MKISFLTFFNDSVGFSLRIRRFEFFISENSLKVSFNIPSWLYISISMILDFCPLLVQLEGQFWFNISYNKRKNVTFLLKRKIKLNNKFTYLI